MGRKQSEHFGSVGRTTIIFNPELFKELENSKEGDYIKDKVLKDGTVLNSVIGTKHKVDINSINQQPEKKEKK